MLMLMIQKAGTERPCYICKRPTSTVLSTIKTEDFLYTCDGHLTDPWVDLVRSSVANDPAACTSTYAVVSTYALTRLSATLIPPTSTGPSPEDIKKVIADYHVREAKKAEAAKEKDKDNDKAKEADKGKDEKKDPKEKTTGPSVSPSIPVASPPASHRKFALHRQVFDMRRNEMKRREQTVKAKEMGKGMPQVPRGMF